MDDIFSLGVNYPFNGEKQEGVSWVGLLPAQPLRSRQEEGTVQSKVLTKIARTLTKHNPICLFFISQHVKKTQEK